ncbi:MAG: hypothetical protein ACJ74W_14700 [Pyrinomonadaceae bacterium]
MVASAILEKETETAEKIERVVRVLAAEQLDSVLLNAQHNFAWLTAGGLNIKPRDECRWPQPAS